MKTVKPKFNVHQAVTDRLLEAMQASDGQVNMPWHHDGQKVPVNVASGKKYRGANIVLLWMTSVVGGYTSNQRATWNQWKKLGGVLRESEVSTTIMFYKKIKFADPDAEESESLADDAEPDVRTRMFAHAYRVYNRCQIDGLGDESEIEVIDPISPIDGADDVQRFFFPRDLNEGNMSDAF